jgi:hypothetical protein
VFITVNEITSKAKIKTAASAKKGNYFMVHIFVLSLLNCAFAALDPGVEFRTFELPQFANFMSGNVCLFNPIPDRIFRYAQISRRLFDSNPIIQ